MATSALREKVDKKLDELNDEQLAELLRYIGIMESNVLPPDYDEDKDPSVGFFSGDPDLASRTSDILRAEFGLRRPQEKKADE
jgi:hypothetical protein